jgi:hypothetical protein
VWLTSTLLLGLLIVGIGLVAGFVFEGGSLVLPAVGASLIVLAWHGLRRLEPRSAYAGRPPESWPVVVVELLIYVVMLLLALWNPWVLLFALIVFPLWLRLTRR